MKSSGHSLRVRLGVWSIIGILGYAQPYRPVLVLGVSMFPAYQSGSIVLASSHIEKIVAGDVVVLNIDGTTMIKRIAFAPGDSIPQFKISHNWIDFLDAGPRSSISSRLAGRMRFREIPKDMYYVLGDNRNCSYDSREYGLVSQDQIERVLLSPRPYRETSLDVTGSSGGFFGSR